MKRFVETTRFHEAWYMDLHPDMKLAFEYVWSQCDNCGVYSPNGKLADLQIGKKIDWAGFSWLMESQGRLEVLPNEKWLLLGFIAFQFGALSPDCRPHKKILDELGKHGIDYNDTCVPAGGYHLSARKRTMLFMRDGAKCVYCGSTEDLVPDHIIPRSKGGKTTFDNLVTACEPCNALKSDMNVSEFIVYLKEPDRVSEYLDRVSAKPDTLLYKEKDKEKDKVREGVKGERKDRATKEELIEYCGTLGLPASDGESLFLKWTGNGWRNGQAPVKDWRATVQNWKLNNWLPSQKPNAKNGNATDDPSLHTRASKYGF